MGETRSTLPESRELNFSLHTVHQYTEQQAPVERKTCITVLPCVCAARCVPLMQSILICVSFTVCTESSVVQ